MSGSTGMLRPTDPLREPPAISRRPRGLARTNWSVGWARKAVHGILPNEVLANERQT